ncbi:MAG: sulfur carrier protein ThiS adenylyltransferase ThiF [Candidatus Cloacimonadaceae bacterium]|nr:sulfur carrier protein ThiS adenylyltransferase ThiF [Candidatus Cloacimonadaceae bacterium]MDP3114797.1 sulfur carrier protein ThiS adenylyltransferase ThiF [Candidatus Cloacimonadaceae bacterium]
MTKNDLYQELYAGHDPEMLQIWQKSVIGIAGAGGLGSNIAVSLARAGIGTLIIADYDTVCTANLNRQQYFLDQVGSLKVEALKANLDRINPFIRIIIHPLKVTPENVGSLFGTAEIMIEAFDLAEQKQMLIESWQSLFPTRPIIAASGLAGVGNNESLKTLQTDNLYIIGDGVSELAPGINPISARVAVVANMQANLCLELLLKMHA